jgi:uncharacterized protein YndB with AHSA1/START domain
MKTYTYSIIINKPVASVFATITDKSTYPDWAKAWGEGMGYEGEWVEGKHIFFHDTSGRGTKAIVNQLIPNEVIKMTHVAMMKSSDTEMELDEVMQKWIGSKEEYYFKETEDGNTEFKVVNVTDESFAEMVDLWNQAVVDIKEVCEKAS